MDFYVSDLAAKKSMLNPSPNPQFSRARVGAFSTSNNKNIISTDNNIYGSIEKLYGSIEQEKDDVVNGN